MAKLLFFWKPHFSWLYKNRYLRMDANVPIYDKARRSFHIDRYEFAVEHLRHINREGLAVLDAACGTGYGADILKRSEPKIVIGVDICPETVRYADKKYGNERCIFKKMDVTDVMEFEDETFDVAVSFETIEHLEQPINFLKCLYKVLKKGGSLIISTPNKWGLTRDHKFDYDYDLFKNHLEQFFDIEDMYVQNSGCMDLWVNRGVPRRIEKATSSNRDEAECFIAICKRSN